MKAHNTYLKEENLLSLLSLNNMIVPEIQREYVWGKVAEKKNKDVLEKFLKNIKENCDDCKNCKQVHKKEDINIGFLYSYKPSYVTVDNERYLDEFLIDGQQRYTTLFLLLAFLAVKENRIKDFLLLVRFDEEIEKISFDYKVRDLTHRFLVDLLKSMRYFDNKINEKIKNKSKKDELAFLSRVSKLLLKSILQIKDSQHFFINQTWFLSDYYADITIQAMLGALYTISKAFNDDYLYFDFVLTAVRFWHFKTEATSQGEELYITMNSRGIKLEDNEKDKAQILSLPPNELYEWGEKWEKWQDFFWRNRDKNDKESNADKGFNEFIRWIKLLESDSAEWKKRASNNNSDFELSKYVEDQPAPEPKTIEIYFNIVEKLAVEKLFENYDTSKNISSWLQENNQTDLFRLLPVIKYVERFELDVEERSIVRVINFFNNLGRIKNVSRSIRGLLPEAIELINSLPNNDIASMLDIDGVSSLIKSKEEERKFELYRDSDYDRNSDYDREELEDRFWDAEKHKIWSGEILPLMQWATENDKFDIDLFDKCNDVFNNKLFYGNLDYPELDITRRALLTRNLKNYPRVFKGYTNYNFCWEYSDWQTLIDDNVVEFGSFIKELNIIDIESQLEKMIQNNPSEAKWDEFVQNAELLEFCECKNIQWHGKKGWVLISGQNLNSRHANLRSYQLYLEFREQPFWNQDFWVDNFYYGGDTCVYFDNKNNNIAIDVFYSETIENIDTNAPEDRYKLQFFNRDSATDADKDFTKIIADKFSLMLEDGRYNSEEKSKENIVKLLKLIMESCEKGDENYINT